MLRTTLCTHAAPNTPVDHRTFMSITTAQRFAFPLSWKGQRPQHSLSGPAQASLSLRPACLLDLLSEAFVSGLRVQQSPAEARLIATEVDRHLPRAGLPPARTVHLSMAHRDIADS
jgi:hypothetical protein